MTQHTTEPWKVSLEDSTPEWSVITAAGGRVVANVNEETGPELIAGVPVMRVMPGELNARRIVACVNALRGVPTEELERHHLAHAGEVRFRIEMTRQRDELLAALEEAKSVLSSINTGRQHKVEVEDDEPAFWQRNEWVTWAKGEILPMIEAAIAKAKGGAA
ncbi:hypothetical protein ACK306_17610 [Aeromonas caviae]